MVNGKRYVGQSRDMGARRKEHFLALRMGRHKNAHLQASFIKYGVVNFEFYILEEAREDMLDFREQAWISYLKSGADLHGYNLDSGGSLNCHPSDKTRRKMFESQKSSLLAIATRRKTIEANKGRCMPDKTRAAIFRANKGSHRSLESREKIAASHRGKHFSVEHKEHLSEAHKEVPLSVEHRKHLSEAHTGPDVSTETRAKLSAANKGRKLSGAHRAKISTAHKRYWAKRCASIANAEIEQ